MTERTPFMLARAAFHESRRLDTAAPYVAEALKQTDPIRRAVADELAHAKFTAEADKVRP